jgi:hypothetical protein
MAPRSLRETLKQDELVLLDVQVGGEQVDLAGAVVLDQRLVGAVVVEVGDVAVEAVTEDDLGEGEHLADGRHAGGGSAGPVGAYDALGGLAGPGLALDALEDDVEHAVRVEVEVSDERLMETASRSV